MLVAGNDAQAPVHLARFDSVGAFDATYTKAATSSLAGIGVTNVTSIAATPDDGSFATATTASNVFLVRLDAAGAIVTGFGDHGVVGSPVAGAGFTVVRSLADGAMVGGVTSAGAFFAKYREGGALDPSFANGGIGSIATD